MRSRKLPEVKYTSNSTCGFGSVTMILHQRGREAHLSIDIVTKQGRTVRVLSNSQKLRRFLCESLDALNYGLGYGLE